MVVALHAAGPFIKIDSSGSWLSIPALLEATTRSAVPLFFMLSGYLWCMAEKKVTLPSAAARMSRSIVPFVFYSAVYAAFVFFYTGTTPKNPLLSPAFYHLWFFYAFIVVTALLLVIKPANVSAIVGATISGSALILCSGGMSTFGAGHAFESLSGSGLYLMYAIAGFYTGNVRSSGRLATLAVVVFGVSMVLTTYLTNLVSNASGQLDQRFYGYNAVLVVVMAFAAFYTLRYIGERSTYGAIVVRSISGVSLGVYGLHPIVLHIALEHLGRGNLALLAALSVSFVMSWSLAYLISKIPYGRRVV